MDGWSVVLLVVAGYVAVATLVRLMLRRRNEVLGQLRGRVADGRTHSSEGDGR